MAYERLFKDTFNITKNFLQYSKETDNPTYDGFWCWLIKNLWWKDSDWSIKEFPENIGKLAESRIKKRFKCPYYSEIKKNYELLKKLYGGENEITN
jgi:hypothetical protein